MSGFWSANRIVLMVGALALLAGTPAVLTAADVRNPWVLGTAAALAGVVVAIGAVWQGRYGQLLRRRDEQALRIEDGCLVLADGRLPRVSEIADPVMLGVHKASAAVLKAGNDGDRRAIEHPPAYVPRDIDGELRSRLAENGLVLLIGDSTAGKSRAAFEAMAAALPDHLLICPVGREGVAVGVIRAAQARRCVLWLDDLEGYVGPGGLTSAHLARLVTGDGHRVVLATIRSAEEARITADVPANELSAHQALRDVRQVLSQAYPIRMSRIFSERELERARALDGDPGVVEALEHAGSYGIAEYLAAGPELLRDWEDARNSSQGPHARGAALVAAAIDIRRAGHTSPIPRALIDEVHEHYLDDQEHARVPRESLARAWTWSTQQRQATTALLQPEPDGRVTVFDYLVDTVQRRAAPGVYVPGEVVTATVRSGDPGDADSIGAAATLQGRYTLAEQAHRRAGEAKSSSPGLGPDHPATLSSRSDRAEALLGMGRLADAEAEFRAILETRIRVLGSEHADSVSSRANLGVCLRCLGRQAEAEAELKAALEISSRILGSERKETLEYRINLGLVYYVQGRLEEAELELREAMDITLRINGPRTIESLAARENHAILLLDLGQLDAAEKEIREVLEIEIETLGAEHPYTLASRNNLASAFREQGRFEEAEAEHRAEMNICSRVLGPEHPDTLNSRKNIALVLRDLGRLDESEAEHRTVLEARARVLGPEHPDTLISRNNLALVLRDLGRLDESEAEHRTVLEARIRVLGPEHPDTLISRNNLAVTLGDSRKITDN